MQSRVYDPSPNLLVKRSTFIFDANGTPKHEIRKVKVKGHVDEVLELVKGL